MCLRACQCTCRTICVFERVSAGVLDAIMCGDDSFSKVSQAAKEIHRVTKRQYATATVVPERVADVSFAGIFPNTASL